MRNPFAPSAHRKSLLRLLACCAASALWPIAVPADALPVALIGNAAHGAQLAAPCASCHGSAGEGVAGTGFPRLAGQYGPYLAGQMHDFAAHLRHRPIMSAAVKSLSEQDLADLGAYYAAMNTPPAAIAPVADAAGYERGHVLVTQGDASIGVAACGSCHGADSSGHAPEMPYIGGQYMQYLSDQFDSWQFGDRHSDRGLVMEAVAKKLSAYDVAAVANWLSRQPPSTHK